MKSTYCIWSNRGTVWLGFLTIISLLYILKILHLKLKRGKTSFQLKYQCQIFHQQCSNTTPHLVSQMTLRCDGFPNPLAHLLTHIATHSLMKPPLRACYHTINSHFVDVILFYLIFLLL